MGSPPIRLLQNPAEPSRSGFAGSLYKLPPPAPDRLEEHCVGFLPEVEVTGDGTPFALMHGVRGFLGSFIEVHRVEPMHDERVAEILATPVESRAPILVARIALEIGVAVKHERAHILDPVDADRVWIDARDVLFSHVAHQGASCRRRAASRPSRRSRARSGRSPTCGR